VGAPDFPRRPLADKFLYRALVRVNDYKCANFQLPSSINFWDKEGVPKFNVYLPYLVRWNFYVCSKYLARSNSAPNFSIVSLCIMQLWEYIFPIFLPLYVPKNVFFWGGGLKVNMWKYCLLTPKMHYPAWIRVRWYIAWQNWFNGLSSRSVERFLRTKKERKKMSGNFGYMGRSNPWRDLDQMWLVGKYGGRNHVCNISLLSVSVKRCGCGERGKFAFSHWLDASPSQHWSHYRVTVW